MKVKIIKKIVLIILAIFIAFMIHYRQVKALENKKADLTSDLSNLTNEVEDTRIKSLTLEEWTSNINELEDKNDKLEEEISKYQELIEEQEKTNQEIKDTM